MQSQAAAVVYRLQVLNEAPVRSIPMRDALRNQTTYCEADRAIDKILLLYNPAQS